MISTNKNIGISLIILIGLFGLLYFSTGVFGSARINLTITTNPNLEDGLVIHHTFDGSDLRDNVTDRSGNNNDGMLSNYGSTTTRPGILGQAIDLSGANTSRRIIGNSDSEVDNMMEMTVSVWIRPDGNGDATQSLFAKNDIDELWIGTYSDGGAEYRRSYTSIDVRTVWNADQIIDNEWNHVVFTIASSTSYSDNKMFVNGEEASVLTSSSLNAVGSVISDASFTYYIGNRDGPSRAFSGLMDDYRVYNRALSDAEILRLYQLGATTKINRTLATNPNLEDGLVAYFSFDSDALELASGSGGSPQTNTGWVAAGSVVEDASAGSDTWANPSNAGTSDNSDAVATTFNGSPSTIVFETRYLKATNFGFSVSGVVDGIEVRHETQGTAFATENENGVFLVNELGTIGSTNRATGENLSFFESIYERGGASDLWGDTWSPSDINDTDFGFVVNFDGSIPSGNSGTVSVDALEMRITYTPSGSGAAFTTALNLANASLNATGTVATSTPGKIGQALRFGYGDALDVLDDNSLDLNDFSIGGWGRLETIGNYQYIVSKIDPGSSQGNYFLYYDNLTTNVYCGYYSGADRETTYDFTAPKGEWVHYFCTYNSATDELKIYMNGVEVSSATFTQTPSTNTGNLRIGDNEALGASWHGKLDDIRVYDRALSEAEVLRVYQLGATTKVNKTITTNPTLKDGLIAHYTFDGNHTDWASTTGGNMEDISGNGYWGDIQDTMTSVDNNRIGVIGQGLYLNGTTDYVRNLDNSWEPTVEANDTASIAYWMRFVDDGSGFMAPAAFGDYDDAITPYLRNGTGNRYDLCVAAASSGQDTCPAALNDRLEEGVWYHVVGTYDQANVRLYLDGVEVFSVAETNQINLTSTALCMGGHQGNFCGTDQFNGTLDDVRFYDRALSAEEVKRLYGLGQ